MKDLKVSRVDWELVGPGFCPCPRYNLITNYIKIEKLNNIKS